MEIYILRHAIAEPAKAGMPDSDRALVPEGRKKLREVIRLARAAGVSPSLILTSPYRRAVQTAEVAAEILGFKQAPVHSRALLPGSSPPDIWEEIRRHKDAASLLLSGHEPLLGQFVGYLLAAPLLQIDLKKGAIVRVDMEQFGLHPRGVLRWFLTPKLALSQSRI